MWIGVFMRCTVWCKNIPSRLREWLSELLHYSAFLGWAAEHFESDSQNLAGMFLHNPVYGLTLAFDVPIFIPPVANL